MSSSEGREMELLKAAGKGDIAAIKRYLDEGGDVNAELHNKLINDRHMTTLLHEAARKGRAPLVTFLIGRGAAVDGEDWDGCTALSACMTKDVVEHGSCDLDVVRVLAEAGARVDGYSAVGAGGGFTPLHGVCAVEPLYEHPMEQQKATIRLLMDKGANMDAEDDVCGRTPIFYARTPAIAAFIFDECGTSIDVVTLRDREGATPLFAARTRQMAEFFISRGVPVDARDRRGRTALFNSIFCWYSSSTETSSVAEVLLRHGADPNATDKDHSAPLHILVASDFNFVLVSASALLQYAADTGGDMPWQWGPNTGGPISPLLAKRIVSKIRYSSSPKGLEPSLISALKWVLTSPDGAEALAAAYQNYARPEGEDAAEKERNRLVKPLKDHAWEKRKHLVCCYFETRRLRREAAIDHSDARAGAGADGR